MSGNLNSITRLKHYVVLLQDSLAIKFSPIDKQEEHPDCTKLFTDFITENSRSYWNTSLLECLKTITLKGFIHPSTLIISSASSVGITTAYTNRVLRPPPNYKIEFIGEVDELLSNPTAQSQFCPLATSICSAIQELNDIGHESFTPNILDILSTSYPLMWQPPKELVHNTLETLIRERKIYQTPTGYFIITPDISVYLSRSSTPIEPQLEWNRFTRHGSLKHIKHNIDMDPTMGKRSLSFRLSSENPVLEKIQQHQKRKRWTLTTLLSYLKRK